MALLLEVAPVAAELLRPDELLSELELLLGAVLLRPVVAAELARGLAEAAVAAAGVLLRPVEAPVVDLVLEPPVAATPVQGATVGEVVVPPLALMVTPATLQFSGICCSMISTKLS
ncbi:MAG TPA: hypothetical protein VK009_03385 [Chloroflexota bacterium]|nr:hypothetical protein [Chloroflexota bacterium]